MLLIVSNPRISISGVYQDVRNKFNLAFSAAACFSLFRVKLEALRLSISVSHFYELNRPPINIYNVDDTLSATRVYLAANSGMMYKI